MAFSDLLDDLSLPDVGSLCSCQQSPVAVDQVVRAHIASLQDGHALRCYKLFRSERRAGGQQSVIDGHRRTIARLLSGAGITLMAMAIVLPVLRPHQIIAWGIAIGFAAAGVECIGA